MLTAEITDYLQQLMIRHEFLHRFDRSNLQDLLAGEVSSILHPLFSVIRSASNFLQIPDVSGCRNHLRKITNQRIDAIGEFMLLLNQAIDNYELKKVGHTSTGPISFQPLAGDSHNGGRRPILIKSPDEEQLVFKPSDPRPHMILAEILKEISAKLSVDLTAPKIFPDANNRWYFIEYLADKEEEEEEEEHIASFMEKIGMLTAVAFALGFVDLHLENLIVSGTKPVIIDPECIFYPFAEQETASDRLLSTGLLSRNAHLSSLRGGQTQAVPMHEFTMYLASDGVIRYRKPFQPHRNRLRARDGGCADPADYKSEFISGYRTAHKWFVDNRDNVCDLINAQVRDDFRIRYLVRKTKHYASVIYMLNLPIEQHANWEDRVIRHFRDSGHFCQEISESLLSAEIRDLQNRDIPYFWMTAGERGAIHHQSGLVHQFGFTASLREKATQHIRSLDRQSLEEQLRTIDDFLGIDLHVPPSQ